MANYVICYDISDKKRLQRAARILQARALRLQKSVYWLAASPSQQQECWKLLLAVIDERYDLLNCYCLPPRTRVESLGKNVLGMGMVWSGFWEDI